MCEKCPNTEFFLVCIFPHSDTIQRDTYLAVFSPNAGKYGPGKTPYLHTFHVVICVKQYYSEQFVLVATCLGGRFGINCASAFLKILNCPGKTRTISKF